MVELGVKISNIGGTTLNIKSLEITPNDNGEFLVSSDCAAVSVGSFCNSVVGFAPVSSGAKAATLVVSLEDLALPTINVALSGVASDTAPASISVSPEEVHIPYVDLEMGDTRSIRINNGGTGSLIINSVTVAGPDASEFSVDSKCTVIAPSSSCDFALSGRYTSQKAKQVSVVIASNASNSSRIEIPITVSSAQCSGGDGDIILSTTSRTVSSEAQNGTVNVTWTGSGSCVLDAVSRSSWISASYNGNSVDLFRNREYNRGLKGGEVYRSAGNPLRSYRAPGPAIQSLTMHPIMSSTTISMPFTRRGLREDAASREARHFSAPPTL